MTKITNVLTIKEPDMFLRKVDLIQEYVFQRIKNALETIKDNIVAPKINNALLNPNIGIS